MGCLFFRAPRSGEYIVFDVCCVLAFAVRIFQMLNWFIMDTRYNMSDRNGKAIGELVNLVEDLIRAADLLFDGENCKQYRHEKFDLWIYFDPEARSTIYFDGHCFEVSVDTDQSFVAFTSAFDSDIEPQVALDLIKSLLI